MSKVIYAKKAVLRINGEVYDLKGVTITYDERALQEDEIIELPENSESDLISEQMASEADLHYADFEPALSEVLSEEMTNE